VPKTKSKRATSNPGIKDSTISNSQGALDKVNQTASDQEKVPGISPSEMFTKRGKKNKKKDRNTCNTTPSISQITMVNES
jgi:hypothetical protein